MENTITPMSFYVVATNSEDNWDQVSIGLDSLEKAQKYLNNDFVQKRWPNAFIVCTIKNIT